MRILLTFITFLVSASVFSQEIQVTGRCTDKKGNPQESVKVVCIDAIQPIVYTNDLGVYELRFEAGSVDKIKVQYTMPGGELKEVRTYKITDSIMVLPDIKFNFQQETSVIIHETKVDPFELPKLKTFDPVMIPNGSVERGLVYTAVGVSSNNELTTNYNVRGGAYNENLVYVNDFLIYRPFLTRSGQQEGMSFIHTALVKDVYFSAGGFNNIYGDRMSSVLDIKYREPDSLHASAVASLLGVQSHVEYAPSSTFSFLAGARYRSNGYLLNSLPTKGAYNPVFWDAQIMTRKMINENLEWTILGHTSTKNYRFSPQTQETDFGTANEAYSFTIYFEGQEQTRFQTMMGGTSLKWKASDRTNLDFFATVFNSNEKEYFDILGQYYINELETDPSKEAYGDSIAVLGIGSFLNHARNKLDATIMNIYHNGKHEIAKGYSPFDSLRLREHTLHWGVNFQMDHFNDILSEWRMIDSAGYSIPQQPADEITLYETIKGKFNLESQRYTSFIQLNSGWSKIQRNKLVTVSRKYKISRGEKERRYFTDTIIESSSRLAMSIGTRAGYTTSNDEFYVTPRFSLKYYPRAYMVQNDRVTRRLWLIRFSSGMYYQPPFYREFRTFDGMLNMNVKAQKSAHFVLGTDAFLNLWDRDAPFKFTAEAYYKYLWDVNPYEIDNVRTRYYADNNAVAYAYGLDLNLNGEFVPGIQSFFKIGFLSTKEDILDDYYYEYYNAAGEKIIFGYSEDQTPVDTVRVEPGYIPRPTDQLVNFGAMIQDRMPGYESFSVNMGMQFGSRLPYGPPDFQRYKDTLRLKSYFRVDIGFAYDFLYKKSEKSTFWNRNFEDAILSFEVFNLLGINNVLSKQWIQDVSGKYYAIPNYLTQRRYNLKLILRI